MRQRDIANKLYEICKDFIEKNEIVCAEAIYQTDHVIENAYEFIEDICNLVGYMEINDEDD